MIIKEVLGAHTWYHFSLRWHVGRWCTDYYMLSKSPNKHPHLGQASSQFTQACITQTRVQSRVVHCTRDPHLQKVVFSFNI